MTGNSVCARCAARRGACCEVGPGQKLATLTSCDIERIEAATGWPASRFAERETLDLPAAQAYEQARPLYRGLFAGGERWGLRASRGACVLLERGRGCLLDAQTRPVACRLYPLDFDELGRLTSVEAPGCLALEEASDEEALLASLGLTRDAVELLRAQLAREVSEHCARRARRR